jgi:hypothetical protein
MELLGGHYDKARDGFAALAEEAPEDRLANDCLDLALTLNETADDPKALERFGAYRKALLLRDHPTARRELETIIKDNPQSAWRRWRSSNWRRRSPRTASRSWPRHNTRRSWRSIPNTAWHPAPWKPPETCSPDRCGRPDLAVTAYERLLMEYPDDLFLDGVRKKLLAARAAAREPHMRRHEFFRPAGRIAILVTGLLLAVAGTARAQQFMLVPMDLSQTNHLKAYGLAYSMLNLGNPGGMAAQLQGWQLPGPPQLGHGARGAGAGRALRDRRRARRRRDQGRDRAREHGGRHPREAAAVAVYTPPNKQPWDDAVTLAMAYAEIPFDKVYDREVLTGKLAEYDWLHLHHEDFTGQYGKFYGSYRLSPWYQEDVRTNEAWRPSWGSRRCRKKRRQWRAPFTITSSRVFPVRDVLGDRHDRPGARRRRHRHRRRRVRPRRPDARAQTKLQYDKTFAFQNFTPELNPARLRVPRTSTPATTPGCADRKPTTSHCSSSRPSTTGSDDADSMSCQRDQWVLGQTTGFRKSLVKDYVVLLGQVEGSDEVKYLHGNLGRGTFTFYGGHDPEDYQHAVGDPPTRLELHVNSPGYRLILNNVLFPAARKKEQKT